jgi:hypothetical protein
MRPAVGFSFFNYFFNKFSGEAFNGFGCKIFVMLNMFPSQNKQQKKKPHCGVGLGMIRVANHLNRILHQGIPNGILVFLL